MAKMKKLPRTPRPNPNHTHFPPQTTTSSQLLHHPNHQPRYSNYENTLVQEVLYLHSLWHRGPPPSSSSHTNSHLKLSHTTHFKTTRNRVSDKEWPVPETHISEPGWPEFRSLNKPVSRPATDQERVRVMGARIQLKGVDSCSGLFRRGGDEDEDDEDEDEDEDEEDEEEEIDFFENLFEKDKELRGFYKENCENGEFYCLVCGAIGGKNKLGRKYLNCVALVQHSVSVSKTKKKKAHKVYGNVICKVLGWDVDRLPSVSKPIEGAKGEAKNQNGEDNTAVEMVRDTTNATQSQADPERIPSTSQGEVKNQSGEDNTADKMVGNTANASQSQADPEGIPSASQKDDGANMDVGCIASRPIQSEAETKDSADGCKVDNPRLCRNLETDVSQRQNNTELPLENAVQKVEEECSVPGIKALECESSLAEKDPFKELQSLPGVFQIPE